MLMARLLYLMKKKVIGSLLMAQAIRKDRCGIVIPPFVMKPGGIAKPPVAEPLIGVPGLAQSILMLPIVTSLICLLLVTKRERMKPKTGKDMDTRDGCLKPLVSS